MQPTLVYIPVTLGLHWLSLLVYIQCQQILTPNFSQQPLCYMGQPTCYIGASGACLLSSIALSARNSSVSPNLRTKTPDARWFPVSGRPVDGRTYAGGSASGLNCRTKKEDIYCDRRRLPKRRGWQNKIRTASYTAARIHSLWKYTFGPGNGVGTGQRSADLTYLTGASQ